MNTFEDKYKNIMEDLTVNKNKAIVESHFNNSSILEGHFSELTEGKDVMVIKDDGMDWKLSKVDSTHYKIGKDSHHVDELKKHPNPNFKKAHAKVTKWLSESTMNEAKEKLEKISAVNFMNLAGKGVIFRGTSQKDLDSVIKSIDNSLRPTQKNYDKVDIKAKHMVRHGKSGKSELRLSSGDKFHKYGNDHIILQSDDGISVYIYKS